MEFNATFIVAFISFIIFTFFTATMYRAYNKADDKTRATPCRFNVIPLFPLYKSPIPTDVSKIENTTVFVIFSLKNIKIKGTTIESPIDTVSPPVRLSISLEFTNQCPVIIFMPHCKIYVIINILKYKNNPL